MAEPRTETTRDGVATLTKRDFTSDQEVRWCPGCGDYAILAAVQSFMPELGVEPHRTVFVSGIGCSGRFTYYMDTYGFHGIHGRAPALATGIAVANPDLSVWVVTGDGDALSIGGNHLIHALRRNVNMRILLFNNQIYGLTKGQYSPTSDKGYISSFSPEGAIEYAVNPMAYAIAAGATFVARGFASDANHLAWLIEEGIKHKGYALIDVLQPCVTYNKVNTNEWYKQRVYKLEETGHDPTDREAAWRKAQEWGDRIPIGIYYRTERPTYEEQVTALKAGPLVFQELDGRVKDYEAIKNEFI